MNPKPRLIDIIKKQRAPTHAWHYKDGTGSAARPHLSILNFSQVPEKTHTCCKD